MPLRRGDPADVAMTTPGGVDSSQAIVDAGALLGVESGEPGPPPAFDVGFVDWPFTDPSATFLQHLAIVRRHEPKLAVAPDIEDARTMDRRIEEADQLAEAAETVIVVPKDIPPERVPDRFRVGLPFQPEFGTGGVSLPERVGGREQTTMLDFGSNRIGDFQGVGPIHVLGGPPHDQLRIPDHGVEVGSLDTALPLQYARFGRVWFRLGQVEFPEHGIYERLEASLRNIRRAWGHDVAQTIELTEQMKEILRADSREERDRIIRFMMSGAHGAPPPFEADEALKPSIERFFNHKYQLPLD